MKKIMSKYDFTPDMADTGIDYTELVTVPDQVLSMYDIYIKYAVRGEIAGLANLILPVTHDNLDDFDSDVDFVPEEDLDILKRSRDLRSRQQDQSHPATEDEPQSYWKTESSPKPQSNAGSGEVSSDLSQAAEQPDSSKDIE